jgi:hypothetical protein
MTGLVVEDSLRTERFLWDLRRTIADMISEYHYGGFQRLASEHGMRFVGEPNGNGMMDLALNSGHIDYPQDTFWWGSVFTPKGKAGKVVSPLAHTYGQRLIYAEAFTGWPDVCKWQEHPGAIKMLGDEAFANGINRFVVHRYVHQPSLDREPGMAFRKWGIHFERTNTWWNPGKAWVDYLSRCQALLQAGDPVADLVYLLSEDIPNNRRHEQRLRGYDYDACATELFLENMTASPGRLEIKGGPAYSLLVLPPAKQVRLEVLRKLAELVEKGANVYGPKPSLSPSLSDASSGDAEFRALADKVWGVNPDSKTHENRVGLGRVFWGDSLDKILAKLKVAPDFQYSSPNPKANVLHAHRRSGTTDFYFVSNQTAQRETLQCRFRVGSKKPELWHADTGERETAEVYSHEGDGTLLPLELGPGASVFVVFRSEVVDDPVVSLKRGGVEIAPGNRSFSGSVLLLEPKVGNGDVFALQAEQPGRYELGRASGRKVELELTEPAQQLPLEGPWELSFPAGKGAPEKIVMDTLASWHLSEEAGVRYFSGTATYRKTFTVATGHLSGGALVLLDLGEVREMVEVTLNGQELGALWKAPYVMDISKHLRQGDNILELAVTNLWPNRLIGDLQPDNAKAVCITTGNPFKAESALLPSGLLGPVKLRIVPRQELSFAK